MRNAAWQWVELGELFEFGAGKTVSPASRAGANPIPFLRTSNVYWDRIDLSSLDYMSLRDGEVEEKRLLPGDLLVCEGGDIGRAAIWNGEVDLITFQNHLHRLRPKTDQIVPRFYVYFLQAAFTQLGMFEGAGNKTTIPNLSKARLAALQVPCPPKDIQEQVTSLLSSLRELVEVKKAEILCVEEIFENLLFLKMTGREEGQAIPDTLLAEAQA